LLLIFKEEQKGRWSLYKELIFVQKKDPRAEQCTGRRLGTE
jgi:hypothetical protein